MDTQELCRNMKSCLLDGKLDRFLEMFSIYISNNDFQNQDHMMLMGAGLLTNLNRENMESYYVLQQRIGIKDLRNEYINYVLQFETKYLIYDEESLLHMYSICCNEYRSAVKNIIDTFSIKSKEQMKVEDLSEKAETLAEFGTISQCFFSAKNFTDI